MSGNRERYEEHQFRKVIPGELESVRKRVCDVLEQFGYAVLGDNPIQGKRRRTKSIWTATVLECQAQLTIALKPISDVSTLATFDYEVEYLFTRGDRQTLEREADAIIALANQPVNRTVCPACSTANDGGVRFCRVCGTPVARQALPPELEVMRMSADASAAHLETTIGLILQLLTLAITVPMILFGPGEVGRVGWVLFGVAEVLVGLVLLQAVRRLHSTVGPSSTEYPPLNVPRTVSTGMRAAIPAPPFSVTEGTTELMNSEEASVSIKPAKTTDSI